jgi:hypothetical protein
VAPIPDVSSSVAITDKFINSIRTVAIVLAPWLTILVDAVIDVDFAPSSSITGGTGTCIVADAIDTG